MTHVGLTDIIMVTSSNA